MRLSCLNEVVVGLSVQSLLSFMISLPEVYSSPAGVDFEYDYCSPSDVQNGVNIEENLQRYVWTENIHKNGMFGYFEEFGLIDFSDKDLTSYSFFMEFDVHFQTPQKSDDENVNSRRVICLSLPVHYMQALRIYFADMLPRATKELFMSGGLVDLRDREAIINMEVELAVLSTVEANFLSMSESESIAERDHEEESRENAARVSPPIDKDGYSSSKSGLQTKIIPVSQRLREVSEWARVTKGAMVNLEGDLLGQCLRCLPFRHREVRIHYITSLVEREFQRLLTEENRVLDHGGSEVDESRDLQAILRLCRGYFAKSLMRYVLQRTEDEVSAFYARRLYQLEASSSNLISHGHDEDSNTGKGTDSAELDRNEKIVLLSHMRGLPSFSAVSSDDIETGAINDDNKGINGSNLVTIVERKEPSLLVLRSYPFEAPYLNSLTDSKKPYNFIEGDESEKYGDEEMRDGKLGSHIEYWCLFSLSVTELEHRTNNTRHSGSASLERVDREITRVIRGRRDNSGGCFTTQKMVCKNRIDYSGSELGMAMPTVAASLLANKTCKHSFDHIMHYAKAVLGSMSLSSVGFPSIYNAANPNPAIEVRPPAMLLIGVGGGQLQSHLRLYFPDVLLHSVEINEAVITAASTFFGFEAQLTTQIGFPWEHIRNSSLQKSSSDEREVMSYLTIGDGFEVVRELVRKAKEKENENGSDAVCMDGDADGQSLSCHHRIGEDIRQDLHTYDFILTDAFDESVKRRIVNGTGSEKTGLGWDGTPKEGISNMPVSKFISELPFLRALVHPTRGIFLAHVHMDSQHQAYLAAIKQSFKYTLVIGVRSNDDVVIASHHDISSWIVQGDESGDDSDRDVSKVFCAHPRQWIKRLDAFASDKGYPKHFFAEIKYLLRC